ncbi:hypothetical protein HY989_00960 [Candidatus Micrarchaeota archaeon]|nr:hypothetical protein [Candidatus Micrarchaeota archaeon]
MKAQTSAEYVTLVALIFVLVASLMLVGFRQQELTLAIASVRLACIDYSSTNPNLACNEIRYYYVGAQNVTVVPISQTQLSANQQLMFQSKIMDAWSAVFKPQNGAPPGKCFVAAYYSYCIQFTS